MRATAAGRTKLEVTSRIIMDFETFGRKTPPAWLSRTAHNVLLFVGFHGIYLMLPVMFTLLPVMLWTSSSPYLRLAGVAMPLVWISRFGCEKKLGSPWPWFADLPLWSVLFSWFPITIKKRKGMRLAGNRTYIFAAHPHGALAFNRAAIGFDYSRLWGAAFPGVDVRVLTASAAFRVPLIREMWLWTFCVDAGKHTARTVLAAGKSIAVYPGGEREQILTVRGKNVLYLTKRKGFVKLALESRSPLVPIYAFGDTELYVHHSVGLKFREWLVKRFGVAIPIITGSLGLLPYKTPITLVVGEPLEPPEPENLDGDVSFPTKAQVDAHHRAYVAAVTELFEKHKADCGFPDAKLIII